MKKYLLPIMALALTFTFVACGDDDDDPKPNNQEQQGGQQGGTTVNYLYSFAKKSYALADETTVTLSITNAKDGTRVVANEDIKVTLSTVEGTTAEEGADYEIPTKEVTIPKGKDKVSFTVKAMTTEPNSEKNTIVIKPTFAGKNFNPGQYATVKVVLVGSFAKKLLGTWVMNQLVTDKDAMFAANWEMVTFGDEFPAFNAEDELTIGATIEPAFKSNFKNYFIGEASYEPAGSLGLRLSPSESVELSILKLTGVNRWFSATETSTDNTAYIGVRNIIDPETSETLLDVYLIDYESHSFAPEFMEFEMYGPYTIKVGDEYQTYPYVAAATGMFINFTMKKKAE